MTNSNDTDWETEIDLKVGRLASNAWKNGLWHSESSLTQDLKNLCVWIKEKAYERALDDVSKRVTARYNERYSHVTREYTPTDHFRDDIYFILSTLKPNKK